MKKSTRRLFSVKLSAFATLALAVFVVVLIEVPVSRAQSAPIGTATQNPYSTSPDGWAFFTNGNAAIVGGPGVTFPGTTVNIYPNYGQAQKGFLTPPNCYTTTTQTVPGNNNTSSITYKETTNCGDHIDSLTISTPDTVSLDCGESFTGPGTFYTSLSDTCTTITVGQPQSIKLSSAVLSGGTIKAYSSNLEPTISNDSFQISGSDGSSYSISSGLTFIADSNGQGIAFSAPAGIGASAGVTYAISAYDVRTNLSGAAVPLLVAPRISSIDLSSSPSQSLAISGSGFSSTGNTVRVENATSSAIVATFANLSSPDGSSLSVTPSTAIPNGAYLVDVQSSSASGIWSNQAPFSVTNDVQVIVLSGLLTTKYNGIFDWMKNNVQMSTPMIEIPFWNFSFSSLAKTLRTDINTALSQKKKVLVIGHSNGSFIAYNIVKEFRAQGKPVSGVYIDPPYNNIIAKIPGIKLLPGASNVIQAISSGIQYEPNTVVWTQGSGLLHFYTHDPFDFPYGSNNNANLANLRDKRIPDALSALESSVGSASVASVDTSSSQPPVLSAVTPSAAAGDTVTISGSGFDTGSNNIYLENVSDPSVFYSIYAVAPSGGSLQFVMPSSPDIEGGVVPGQYSVQVSGLDTDMSNSLTMTINASAGAPAPSATIPGNTDAGSSMSVSGSGFAPTGNQVRFVSVQPSGMAPAGRGSSPKSFMAAAGQVASSIFSWIGSLFSGSSASSPSSSMGGSAPDFVLTDIPSPDGATLSFSVPPDMPSGSYDVQVSADGVNWSDAQQTVVSGSQISSYVSDPQPATISYSCTSGSLRPGGLCYIPAHTVTTPASTINATPHYYCSNGTNPLGNMCACPPSAVICLSPPGPAAVSYSCPTGSIPETATTCSVPASTSMIPATTVGAASSYVCPSGFNLVGSQCYAQGPTGLSANGNPSAINLAWSASSPYARFYEIDRSSDQGVTFDTVGVTQAPNATLVDASIPAAGSYRYVARAIRADGTYSTSSNTVSISISSLASSTISVSTGAIPAYGCSIVNYLVYSLSPQNTCVFFGQPTLPAKIVGYYCSDATYTASGTSCILNGGGSLPAGAIPATTAYGCPVSNSSVYSLTSINTCVSTGLATVMAQVVGYSCPDSRYVLSGKICKPINNGVSTATMQPAQVAYKCPISDSFVYSLTSLNTCVATAQTTIMAPILGYYCSDANYTASSTSCLLNGGAATSSDSQPARTIYACPTSNSFTYTLTAQNTCTAFAQTSVMASISGYSCPSGLVLSNRACMTNARALTPPKSLAATASGISSAKLTWSLNSSSGFSNISIERSTFKKGPLAQIAAVGSSTSYVDTGLTASTTYYYNIRFQYPSGLYSAYAGTSTITTGKLSKPTASLSAVGTSTASLSWTDGDAGLTGFNISQTLPSPVFIVSTPSTTKKYALSGLYPATKYCFSVSAYAGFSSVSASSTTACGTTTAATTSAKATYGCPTGWTLSGSTCSGSVAGAMIAASTTSACPSGYSPSALIAGQCYQGSTLNLTAALTTSYSCPSGYMLNSATHMCKGPSVASTTPATTSYSCPAGYSFDATANICKR